jgi:dienelactone hydrolase
MPLSLEDSARRIRFRPLPSVSRGHSARHGSLALPTAWLGPLVILTLSFAVAFPQLSSGDSPEEAGNRMAPHFRVPDEWQGQFGDYRSPLLFDDDTQVTQANQWPARRQEILSYWTKMLGPWPDVLENPELTVIRQHTEDGLIWKRVRVQTAAEQFSEGWLLLPEGSGPFPAVLVVYYEPETSVGLAPPGREPGALRDFAKQLSQRGFVTLSIGTPGGDARYPDLAEAVCQPLSYHGYVAANCWQALAGLPEVDADRIGVTGHSYGGKWALFAAALWDRFAAVAVSDPGIVFDETRGNVNYWEPWYLGLDPEAERRRPGIPSDSNPRTGAYRLLREANRDLHELHALLAPRPFLVSGGAEDPENRWEALHHLVAVNELLDKPGRVGMTNRPSHAPTEESNAVLYDFFIHFLGAKPE